MKFKPPVMTVPVLPLDLYTDITGELIPIKQHPFSIGQSTTWIKQLIIHEPIRQKSIIKFINLQYFGKSTQHRYDYLAKSRVAFFGRQLPPLSNINQGEKDIKGRCM